MLGVLPHRCAQRADLACWNILPEVGDRERTFHRPGMANKSNLSIWGHQRVKRHLFQGEGRWPGLLSSIFRDVLGIDHHRDIRTKGSSLPGELTKPGADTEMTIFRPVLLHLSRWVGRTGLLPCLEGAEKITWYILTPPMGPPCVFMHIGVRSRVFCTSSPPTPSQGHTLYQYMTEDRRSGVALGASFALSWFATGVWCLPQTDH